MAGNGDLKKRLWTWAKRALGIVTVLGIGAMIVLAMMPKPVPVDLVTAETGPLRVTVDEDGRTRVKDRYVLSAPLTGNVARIELDPGDAVEEGTVLARIVPLEPPLMDARSRAQAEAQVAAAQAAARQARATMDRISTGAEFARREAERQARLHSQGTVSDVARDRAELERRTAEEEVSSASFAVRVADYEVRVAQAAVRRHGTRPGEDEQLEVGSPVAGTVLRVIQESEGVVQAGTPLIEVGDAAALEVVVDVLTSDAVHVRPGARVVLERWGGEGALSGHVRIVEPSAFTRISALGVEEQRVNVVIDIDDPYEEWRALGDGYRVEARIIVAEEADVLRVPASAVFRQADGWAVYAVRDGRAALVPIEIGLRNGLEAQIASGLDAGARVILHPSDQVKDGVAVEAR
jgi:HlyD family secretion protein